VDSPADRRFARPWCWQVFVIGVEVVKCESNSPKVVTAVISETNVARSPERGRVYINNKE